MKKFYLFIATALAGLIMLSVTAVKAQNMNRYITLIVQQGQKIGLSFVADTANTVVRVVSGTTDTIHYIDTKWTDNISYYAQSDTMRIYGNVKEFSCGGNGIVTARIKGITGSNNKGLIELYCDNNQLSFLDISGLTALRFLYCYGNQLSACGLDSLFHQLPIRTEDSKGKVYIKYRTETNPGTYFCRDTIATNKFWDVLELCYTPIKNTTYACPYFTLGVKEIKQDNIRFYPNPVSATLYIESKADISRIEVYDVLGRWQLSTTYSTTIDCSTLSAGIYILKLTTPQGNLIKKFVKE